MEASSDQIQFGVGEWFWGGGHVWEQSDTGVWGGWPSVLAPQTKKTQT